MKVVVDFKKIQEYFVTTIVSLLTIWCANYGVGLLISLSGGRIFDLYVMSFHKIKNKGAAFNILSNNPEVIAALSLIALISIIFFVLFRSNKLNRLNTSALGILSAGIGMNFYERITKGYVTDYIDLSFIPNMPIFNVADIFIITGTFLLICSLFVKK